MGLIAIPVWDPRMDEFGYTHDPLMIIALLFRGPPTNAH